jgi:3',5'-cyclic AMP phosphodiesterase CpdA
VDVSPPEGMGRAIVPGIFRWNYGVRPSRLTHHGAVASGAQMAKRQNNSSSGATTVEILHLTDIHAGEKEYLDQDNKAKIKAADRPRMLERLERYLCELPRPADFVVVSGDMTIHADPKGMTDVRDWLEKGIRKKFLPPANRIIVMPGNHDVTWLNDPGDKLESRYDLFFETFGKTFPHSHIDGHDPVGNSLPKPRDTAVLGGIDIKVEFGRPKLVSSLPFLLDLKSNVLIYAFDSTSACGTFLDLDKSIEEPLASLKTLYRGSVEQSKLIDDIRKGYRLSRRVDAPLVGKKQIDAFLSTIKDLKKMLGAGYARLTKVAALHHHISPLWEQQMEAKSFEAIIDAAQVRQVLVEQQFDLVLHGHKHQNQVSLDSQVVPISNKQSLSPICIVSGGTVGNYPRMGDRQTFKLISLKGGRQPRNDAIIREIPLLDSDPQRVMATEAKIYQIPLAKDLPDIHDLSQLKSGLDEFAFQKGVGSLLKRKGAVIHRHGAITMPVSEPDIVSKGHTYEFFAVVASGRERIFIDVFLAERPLSFRQRARIHWMLHEVKKLNERDSANRVLLIIGNLDGTHFSRSLAPGKIEDSIDELKRWFAPAIKSSLLELKHYNISQADVDRLGKALSFGDQYGNAK